MPAPHEILGLEPDANRQQIVDAYRRLAEIYHPDRYATARAQVREEAAKRMCELNDARDQMLRGAGEARSDATSASASTEEPPPNAPGRSAAQRSVRVARGCAVTAAAVLAGLAGLALMVGIFGDNLALIFVSIGASILVVPALVVAVIASARR